MSLTYKNPISSSQLVSTESVNRESTFGTNFSVLQVGGYMEVYELSDLQFTVPSGSTGTIEFSGNVIPINYSVRNLAFLPDTITLNSDNISSGRRRLGMLVYVHETQQTYRYTIPNYDTLWNNASGSTQDSDFTTTVTTSTQGGQDFINAWLDSSIEGVNGVTRENARWRLFYGTDTKVTGGTITYNSTGDLDLRLNDDSLVNIIGLSKITGGTLTDSILTLTDNLGKGVNISGFDFEDTYLTGATYTPTTLTLGMSDGEIVEVGGFAADITGGTYNDGTLSLSKNNGEFVDITGITFDSTNIYNTNGQLNEDRIIDQDNNHITFSGNGMSVGTGTTSPVCALLELASTNQGLLIPRMTQVQRLAINTPLPGLLVYCTNTDGNGSEGMFMYKSNGWVNVL